MAARPVPWPCCAPLRCATAPPQRVGLRLRVLGGGAISRITAASPGAARPGRERPQACKWAAATARRGVLRPFPCATSCSPVASLPLRARHVFEQAHHP
eukprot:CAMPEP_0185204666 /NCGR_PEP_ID=MMETSP1140-20130426/55304_1 /TAXON_ID=298111 /ORGANISM="Pavlova sp., Strain CCMP459" /LENGTH=98 /DNA_ID=CAMNT_0027772231 /DNA_START=35 /DNA_END=328 /DNA_ORIENTATION=+